MPIASTITNAGVDHATVADWRTTTTAKPLDVDGDNIYGTDGYYVIYSGGGFFNTTPSYLSSISEHGGRHIEGGSWGREFPYI